MNRSSRAGLPAITEPTASPVTSRQASSSLGHHWPPLACVLTQLSLWAQAWGTMGLLYRGHGVEVPREVVRKNKDQWCSEGSKFPWLSWLLFQKNYLFNRKKIKVFRSSGASSCRHTGWHRRKAWKKFKVRRLATCRLLSHQFTDLLSLVNKDFTLPFNKHVGFSFSVCVCLPFTMGLPKVNFFNIDWNMEELPKAGKIPVCYDSKLGEFL